MVSDIKICFRFKEAAPHDRIVTMYAVEDTGNGLIPHISLNGNIMGSGAVCKAGDYSCELQWSSELQGSIQIANAPHLS
jgi:hypothetical protein